MKSQLKITLTLTFSLLALFSWACPSGAGNAEPDRTPKSKIEEMVVTGTRSQRDQDKIVATVEVIKARELEQLPLDTWDGALNYLPGIQIQRPDGIGHQIPITAKIRGVGGPRQNLVLLDGMPINNPINGFITVHTIPVDIIDHVEVVKGPYSSLYGSYAMGGVINIITKRGDSPRPRVTAHASLGTYGFWEAGARVSGLEGGLDYSLGYNHRRTNNYLWRDTETRRVFNRRARRMEEKEFDVKNRDLRADILDLHLGYRANPDHRISLTGLFYKDHQGSGVPTYLAGRFEPYDNTVNLHLALSGDHKLPADYQFKWKLYDNYAQSKGQGESMESSPSGGGRGGMAYSPSMGRGRSPRYFRDDADNSGNELGAQVQLARSFADWNMFTIGLDATRNSASWKKTDMDLNRRVVDRSKDIHNLAPYLQVELFLLDNRLLITPGVRLDFHSEAGSAVSPKLSARYKLTEQLSLRASAGRAFRAPTLNELFSPTWMMIPGVPFESNPDLKPEYLWSGDLGLEYKTRRLRAGLTGFYSKGDDFIQAVISRGVQKYQNVEDVKVYGLEAGLEFNPWEWLTLFSSYTYTHSENAASGDPLTDTPKHMIKAGVMASRRIGDFRIFGNLAAQYIGERYYASGMGSSDLSSDNYTLVDAGAGVQYKDVVTVSLKVKNMFDEKWFPHGTQPGPSRAFWLEASLAFDTGL